MKGSSRCGLSTFKAARSDASQFRGLDESGIVVCCCRHGLIIHAGNMYQGETYRHTHYAHLAAYKWGATFFCSYVVCKYWNFARKVGQKFPEWSGLTDRSVPHLSRCKNHKFSAGLILWPFKKKVRLQLLERKWNRDFPNSLDMEASRNTCQNLVSSSQKLFT